MYNFVLHASQCTNNCVFCHGREFGDVEENIQEEFEKLDHIIKSGNLIETLEISGNDPCEYPRLPSLVVEMKKKTGAKKIILSSHGKTLGSKNFLEALIDAGVTEFIIPLYGSSPKVHDAVTQSPGSFLLSMKGVKNLLEYKKKIIISTLITKENQEYIQETFLFLSKISKDFSVSVPCYSNVGTFSQSFPDFKHFKKRLSDALLVLEQMNVFPWLRNIPYCLVDFYYSHHEESSLPKYGYQHFKHYKHKVKVQDDGELIPEYRLQVKGEECKKCIYDKKCSGFYKTYVDAGVFEFKPIEKE